MGGSVIRVLRSKKFLVLLAGLVTAVSAAAIASLDHPNLCTIIEVEEAENGQLFIVETEVRP